ncbi:MAG: SDR family NAD(P)-dependent oxidoreductase, partial [Octadecabacter sp.]|nr:SDR family NAD(P)-dependent oxidoreductase [Octadecabacter sp.]
MRLNGKTAIVTGGASGFGAGIVRKFVAEGARVLIADMNLEGGEALAAELGEGVAAIQTNVARNDDVAAMTAAALKAFGRIDILVNNAGTTHMPAPMEDISEEDFDRVLAVNAKSVFLTARHIVPLLKSQKTGAILNVASTAAVS